MEEEGISPQSNEMTVAVNGVVLCGSPVSGVILQKKGYHPWSQRGGMMWGDIAGDGISPLVLFRGGLAGGWTSPLDLFWGRGDLAGSGISPPKNLHDGFSRKMAPLFISMWWVRCWSVIVSVQRLSLTLL